MAEPLFYTKFFAVLIFLRILIKHKKAGSARETFFAAENY